MKPATFTLALAAGLAGTIAGYFALVAHEPTALAPTDKMTGDASVTAYCRSRDLGGGEVAIPHRSMGNRSRICVQRGRLRRRAELYLRAKLGSCDCTTCFADDADLDRLSDFDLLGAEVSPLSTGRPVTIAWMKGRSRAYTLAARNRPAKSAISVAFSDRCDMIVATVVLPHDRPATIEPVVME